MITISSVEKLTEFVNTARTIWTEELQRPIPDDMLAAWIAAFSAGQTGEQMRAALQASAEDVEKHKVKPFTPLPRLRVRGQFFELETGARFTAIQASDFNLLARWQHGEDIDLVLAQRQAIGFNLLRVWTLYDLASANVGTFLDIDYARVPAFLDLCAGYGLYVEFTAYTSTERTDHWERLVTAVQGKTNALIELVNEEDQLENHIDLARYSRPSGVLASHGSNGSEAWPVPSPWDYETFHTNGASEWWRKTGHNAAEIGWAPEHGKPVIANENTRFCDNDSSVNHAYDAAAGAALLAAGSCYHSVGGKSSVLWTGCELEAAKAWAAGARSVDLSQQDAPYEHVIDLEGPDDLRVYRRGTAVVRIRK